jgi:hypothetical protein
LNERVLLVDRFLLKKLTRHLDDYAFVGQCARELLHRNVRTGDVVAQFNTSYKTLERATLA